MHRHIRSLRGRTEAMRGHPVQVKVDRVLGEPLRWAVTRLGPKPNDALQVEGLRLGVDAPIVREEVERPHVGRMARRKVGEIARHDQAGPRQLEWQRRRRRRRRVVNVVLHARSQAGRSRDSKHQPQSQIMSQCWLRREAQVRNTGNAPARPSTLLGSGTSLCPQARSRRRQSCSMRARACMCEAHVLHACAPHLSPSLPPSPLVFRRMHDPRRSHQTKERRRARHEYTPQRGGGGAGDVADVVGAAHMPSAIAEVVRGRRCAAPLFVANAQLALRSSARDDAVRQTAGTARAIKSCFVANSHTNEVGERFVALVNVELHACGRVASRMHHASHRYRSGTTHTVGRYLPVPRCRCR